MGLPLNYYYGFAFYIGLKKIEDKYCARLFQFIVTQNRLN